MKKFPLMLPAGPVPARPFALLSPPPEGRPSPMATVQPDLDFTTGENSGDDLSRIVLVAKTVPARYWKMLTFPLYTGAKWIRDPDILVENFVHPRGDCTVDITLGAAIDERLPGPGHHMVPGETNYEDGTCSVTDRSLGRELTIHFENTEPDATALLADDGDFPFYLEPFADEAAWRTRDSHKPIAELADELADETRYDTVLNVLAWLVENCKYGADGVDKNQHLPAFFKHRRGTCQQFAGLAALLLRFAGHPTRCVGGLTFPDVFDDELPLLASSAHAWIEVYFHSVGWVTFDPTQGAEGDDRVDQQRIGESPPPIEEYSFAEPEDVDPWTRVFARDLRQILARAQRPRPAGAYETGTRLNTSQLYRVATKDNRLMSRRTRVPTEPAEILFAIDESFSIAELPMTLKRCYERSRWMVAEGLRKADQDFALLGFKEDCHVYKNLTQPWNDAARRRLRLTASARLSGRSGDGGTNQAIAIKTARELHKKAGAHRHRYLFLLTDGEPNTKAGRDYWHDVGQSVGGKRRSCAAVVDAFERRTVREQVELAHSENLTVVALVITDMWREEKEAFLKALEDMFDRSVILGRTRQEVENQLRFGLLDAIRGR